MRRHEFLAFSLLSGIFGTFSHHLSCIAGKYFTVKFTPLYKELTSIQNYCLFSLYWYFTLQCVMNIESLEQWNSYEGITPCIA